MNSAAGVDIHFDDRAARRSDTLNSVSFPRLRPGFFLAHWVRQVLGFAVGGFGVGCFAVAVAVAGIRVLLVVLHASPLCGAAPTFLCRGKEK
jgi:hypothetical protein